MLTSIVIGFNSRYYLRWCSADVIVIANVFSGIDTNVIVSSVYNDFNYEVYEFTIDMVKYLNQTIQVKIDNTDSRFETITHLSEKNRCSSKFR
jgi:hypothetical protein